MNKLFPILILSLFAYKLSATHIIGGSISYSDLGSNLYEVKLEVLRDCFEGAAEAPFDEIATVGIFNEFGELLLNLGTFGQLQIPLDPNTIDTISLLDLNQVCDYSDYVCVERAVYTDTLVIPNQSLDVILSYQRCCRSNIIANIIDPLETGMTFFTSLNTSIENSSPIFNETFPVAVYFGTPFRYDAGAVDPDGDFLLFELANPIGGATSSDPMPRPPSAPPYDVVSYLPPFSMDNIFGGSFPLRINALNGEIRAIPEIVGVFQVSYLVKEFRAGELIGVTRREFVFEVAAPPGNQKFDIHGDVFVDSLTNLDKGSVQLLRKDIFQNSTEIVDETEIGADGSYAFNDIPPGVFYAKAIIDSTSQYFDEFIPTYFESSAYWYEAIALDQCDTSIVERDIFLLKSQKSSNGINLEGRAIIDNDINKPAHDLDLFLVNENNEYIQHRKTDALGEFIFSNIEPGPYFLHADILNSNIENNSAPLLDIGGSNYALVSVLEDSLEVNLMTDVNLGPIDDELELVVLPNPVTNHLYLNIKSSKTSVMTGSLYNNNGVLIKNIDSELAQWDSKNPIHIFVDSLQSGIYFIKVVSEEGYVTTRFIKH